MKTRNFALVLTMAALLPAYAHADAVLDSFKRDMNHETIVSQSAVSGTTDPFADVFYAALNGTDTVLASFERDMNHEPVVSQDTMLASSSDPIADFINAGLRGTTLIDVAANGTIDPVLASFERDMNREPVATVLASSDDPLSDLFYAALYGRTDTELANSERDTNRKPAV